MLGRMTSVIYLFIGFAALLAVVILYNLGILSYSEKQYQFATLKVLGYRTKALRHIFNQQGRILALISILLGLPAGYWMISYIFEAALGDSYDFRAYIRPVSYVIAGIGIFLVSALVNDLMSRKIRSIDMVSSLKANE
jgi:ABC-type antimicrobial peptide transport system permease subunit